MEKESKLKNYFTDLFKKTYPNYDEEIYKNFITYYETMYEQRIKKYINNDVVIYSIILEIEKLFKLSYLEFEKIITLDPNYEQMIYIRKKILNVCVSVRKGNLEQSLIKELEEYLDNLKEMEKNVLEINKEAAAELYANCLLDVNYLFNEEETTMSLGLARILN